MKTNKLILCLLSVMAIDPVLGQDDSLTLFPAEESDEQQNQNTARQPERARETTPAFTLKGTSRFGDRYHTSLLSRDGQSVQVSWRQGSSAELPGHLGYRVVDVRSRGVSLQYPAGVNCIEAADKGVTCNSGGNIALLSLATAEPIAVPDPVPAADDAELVEAMEAGEGDAVAVEEAEALPLNPFSGEPQQPVRISEEERQARAARQAARMRALQNFEPVRIPDSEVPPGMRKIETPFGDRLVPDEN